MGHETEVSPKPEERGKYFFFLLLLSSEGVGHALRASIISALYLTTSFLLQKAARGSTLSFSTLSQ